MKLLLDNNLSHRLVEKLKEHFPNSSHVMFEGMDDSEDHHIWEFAKNNDFTIVTKDSDFNDLSILYGSPPKVIWLRLGNCKVKDIEHIFKSQKEELAKFIHGDLKLFEIE